MRVPLTILSILILPFALSAQVVKPPVTKTKQTQDKKQTQEKKDQGKKDKKDEITGDLIADEFILPVGSDPADLAAMQGALDMIEAEKKLAEMLKNGTLEGIDLIVPFEEIAAWPYEQGLQGMPEELNKLNGKTVMMTGFMLPIDAVENIEEFLLVQSLWSCCYGQPPDINGTVRVVMKGDKRIDYKFDPIKIVGTFKIEATMQEGFCVDIYQLETEQVEVIR